MTDGEGRRKWVKRCGDAAMNVRCIEATAQHVICGQCEGIGPKGERKRELVDALRVVARAMQSKERKNRKNKKCFR